ncbi:MAG: protein kinase [Ktedonobacteraceae bacterium]|nr:protein kinase [Ktedonobacteraceae bacterium]
MKVIRHCPPGSLMRLERLLALQHPYIHQCQHTGRINQENSLYFLSRYEETGSLARYLHAGVSLPVATIASIALQVAQALQYVHEQNLVHGYLRPENCLVVSPTAVQVSDFYHVFLTREAGIAPSLYTAPEQLQGTILSVSDQYALAVVICQLLACHLNARMIKTDNMQLQRRPVDLPLETILATLPTTIQQTLIRALSPSPAQRFPDILEFAYMLYAALGQGQPSGSLKALSAPGVVPTPPPFPAVQASNSGPLSALSPSSPGRYLGDLPKLRNQPQPSLQDTPSRLPGHTTEVSVVRWAPDGIHLASTGTDRRIMIWFARQRIGTPLGTINGHEATVNALSWSPDGRMLASAAEDASIRLWQIITTPSFQVHAGPGWWGHDGAITALEWSPQGGRLASGGRDQMLRLWDIQGNSQASWQAHSRGGITALAWSGNGQVLATGGADRQIYLWDVSSGARIGHFTAHTDEIRYLRWSPQGRLLASSAGKKDPQIQLWDVQEKRRLIAFSGHKREVVGLFWSADGNWLISVSADRIMRCWNTVQLSGASPGASIAMEGTPLTMDGTAATHLLALGTSDMLVLLQQLQS